VKKKKQLMGKELVDAAVKLAEDKKATPIVVLDLREASTVADWFVICGSDNPAQSRAIAESIADGLAQMNTVAWHVEGTQEGRWVLIDFVDVVIHVMLDELRDYYDLEHLFEKAIIVEERLSDGK